MILPTIEEDKVAAARETKLIQFHAALSILLQDDLKKGCIELRLLGGMDALKKWMIIWFTTSHHTKPPYPTKIDVLPIFFLQIILAAKWLVRHSIQVLYVQ